MRTRSYVLSLVPLAWAGAAQAAEGGGAGLFFGQLGNLLLLLGVLFYLARKPLQNFFAERRGQIQGDLEDAAGLLEAAETRYAEWQSKLGEVQQEIETIASEGRQRAEEEAEAILADAQATAERIHRDAASAASQELRRAQAQLRTEAAQLATQMAEQILKEQLADPDRERLIDEFIVRVEPGEK